MINYLINYLIINHFYLIMNSVIITNGLLKGKRIIKSEFESLKRLGVNFKQLRNEDLKKGVFIKLRRSHVVKLIVINKRLRNINELTNLKYLEDVYLNNNGLSMLPEDIGLLINLKTLSVVNNELTKLPESIGELRNLLVLFLENNKLTSLPESISNLTNLVKLNAECNQIKSLPEGIGNLSKLTTLVLMFNQLTKLPKSISKLRNLRNINLSENKANNFKISIMVK